MKNKTTIIFIMLLSFFTTALSQTTIKYTYDKAGNRISRQKPTANTLNKSKRTPSNHNNDQNDNDNVIISYSETSEIISINAHSFTQAEAIHINIFSTEGALVMSKEINSNNGFIYIGNLPYGTYIISVVQDKKRTIKKISRKE